ncbi:hypothetical protein NL676_003018 [Syzygium grande]|nr:hypothetical protein NL676_003018 [Syzygium grande]
MASRWCAVDLVELLVNVANGGGARWFAMGVTSGWSSWHPVACVVRPMGSCGHQSEVLTLVWLGIADTQCANSATT